MYDSKQLMVFGAFGNPRKIRTGVTTTVIRFKLRHQMLEKGTGPNAPTKKISSKEYRS